MALLDFDRLAARYAQELAEEGIPLSAPISAAAVLADLARLAGVPTPWMIDTESEAFEAPLYPEGA
ncbi:MAG: hypothetical protein M3P51_13165 [Chloroflexota bacterium]|nr:hypothetical protein [Chloroflexota bacterium]